MPERIARIFASREGLGERIRALGSQIEADDGDDLLLVTMLHGGVWFLADLVRTLPPTVEVDFLRLSPYAEGEHPPGAARILKDLDQPVTGRDVLVVEDVVETGLSLGFLLRNLEEREPARIRICTLLDRAAKRLVDLPVVYRGFELTDEYIVGYGLDFLGLYRNLPCLVAIEDLEVLRRDPFTLEAHLREWGLWER